MRNPHYRDLRFFSSPTERRRTLFSLVKRGIHAQLRKDKINTTDLRTFLFNCKRFPEFLRYGRQMLLRASNISNVTPIRRLMLDNLQSLLTVNGY